MHEKPLSMEQYLAAPTIVEPFRKEDCCLISDGGAAYLMTTPERARDLSRPVVEVAGVGLGNSVTGAHWAQQPAFTSTPQVFAAPVAFGMAGITPADVDVYTCYDPFTIVHAHADRGQRLLREGRGRRVRRAATPSHFDSGELPTNTHGGLLSHAYVLGIAHVVEVVRQLRGEAAAQVPDAEIGVYGGYTGPQASTLVLRRAS